MQLDDKIKIEANFYSLTADVWFVLWIFLKLEFIHFYFI
jgi:hypothetical protein